MKKALISALLAFSLLLAGCGGHTPPEKSDLANPLAAERIDTHATTTIITYLPSVDSRQLVQRSREMVVPEGQMLLQAAIVNLLSEAGDERTTPLFGGGASLKTMTKSRNVLLIDLTSQLTLEAMDEQMLLNSVSALVNTVTANSTVEYIHLWINGQSLASRGVLTNPLTSLDTDLEQLWILHKYYMEAGEISPDQPEQQVLFYTDTSGQYLLASASEPVTRSGNRVDDLIQQMRQAPSGAPGLVSAIPSSLTLSKSPQLEMTPEGEQVVSVWFSSPKYENFSGQKAYLLAGAITMAIYCNFPDVDSVLIYVDNRLITSLPDVDLPAGEPLTSGQFLSAVADMTTLYFPHQQTGKLVAVQRATSQSDTSQLRVRIDELIRGPLAGEDSALTYAFPVGITAQDLISVQSQGGCATVNFSSNFENYYPTDTDKERLMIYSIVNTLTSEPSINRVQILVEDRRVGALGAIDLTNPLIRNPGMIQASP